MYVISFNKNIVKIAIENNSLSLYNALIVKEIGLMLEVRELNVHSALCLSIGDASLLKINMKVELYSNILELNFYHKYIGRVVDPMFNLISESVPIQKDDKYIPVKVRSDPVNFYETNHTMQIMTTGIKVIDFFAPYIKGGKVGVIGGAGIGKTTLMLEIINNLLFEDYFVIFAGVGERIREGHAFYEEIIEAKLIDINDPEKSNIGIIFGNMDQVPSVRYMSAQSGIALAESVRNTMKKDVLVLIDNIFRFLQAGNEISSSLNQVPTEMGYQPDLFSSMSYIQERINSTRDGSITSIQTIYVPADDNTDPAVLSCKNHMDTIICLDRALAFKGIYPSIDPLKSYSKALNKECISPQHYSVYKKTIRMLQRYSDLENIIKIMGIDNLSQEDQQIVYRSRLVYSYITQPFKVSYQFTGIQGETVALDVVIQEVEEIIEGVYDSVDPNSILYKGSIVSFKYN